MMDYMKLNNRRIKFFIWFGYCLSVCNAIILIKFGRAPAHYRGNIKNDNKDLPGDSFENFGLQSRQLLCDAAINAKQFMYKYNSFGQYRARQESLYSLTNWGSLSALRRGTSCNYQRMKAGQLRENPDPKCLQYRHRWTRLGKKKNLRIKSIQCVNEMTIKWFLIFGLVDKYMYLLEPASDKHSAFLRMTGIFDPMAIVDNQPAPYFYDQFRTSKGELESIVCNLGAEDVLRLCGAILVLLSHKDSLPNNNYMIKERDPCLKKNVKMEDEFLKARFLRCTIIQEKRISIPFYALGDANESGAVFVFSVGPSKELELHTRLIKVASLMNPVSNKSESPMQNIKRNLSSEISLSDEWGQKRQRSHRGRRVQHS